MKNWFSEGDSIAVCQQKSPLDALETRMLLSHVTGLSRVQLITQNQENLAAQQLTQLNQLIAQRVAGEPLAYLLGEREFYGLRFKVSSAVLIPRPDTELLVDLALQYTPPNGHLLDLGTGSGAIAVSIAAQSSEMQISACDISTQALAIARENAERLLPNRKPVQFYQSNWFSAIPAQAFNTIVSNPPYIVKGDQHLSQGDLRFEPIDALTDHADGLSAYRRIISDAPAYLAKNAFLLMEHGYDQSAAVQSLLSQAGFIDIQSWADLAGILRVTGGRWAANKDG